MREILTAIAVTAGILAVCMGAGEADMRGPAFILAIIAGLTAGTRESFVGEK